MVGLYRTLDERRQEVANLVADASRGREVAKLAAHFGTADLSKIDTALLRLGSCAPEDALKVACAVLQALDARLRDRRDELAHSVMKADADGDWLLFPEEERPILDLLREGGRELGREPDDFGPTLRGLLGLWWRPVSLRDRAVRPVPHQASEALAQVLRQRGVELRIALGAPFTELDFDHESDPGGKTERYGTPYRFVRLRAKHDDTAERELRAVVERCRSEEVDVLVLPELTIDEDRLALLRRLLREGGRQRHPCLVIAGSFHVACADRWRNRAVVLDWAGRIVLDHDKCTRFRLTADEARAMPPEMLERLGIDRDGGFEQIEVADALHLLDTPLGRMSVPICLDYVGDTLRDLWLDTGTNVLWVPTMSPRFERFPERARELGERGRCATFVVNSAWLLRFVHSPGHEGMALAYLPGHRTSRRWRLDEWPTAVGALVTFTIRQLAG